jgi:isocitrate dehydrogenase kinase/phosphatase
MIRGVSVPAEETPASRIANQVAPAILAAYEAYSAAFAEITRRAQRRFELREWAASLADATERLDLYGRRITALEQEVRYALGLRLTDSALWAGMKAVYSGLIASRDDVELAETWFNSLTRRIFTTVGVDSNIEFVDPDFEFVPIGAEPIQRVYNHPKSPAKLFEAVLRGAGFGVGFAHLEEDCALAGRRLTQQLQELEIAHSIEQAQVLKVPFFRRKGAYLIGRLRVAGRQVPLAIALLNGPDGIAVDAVLTDEDDISILFSFTRSHFHVALEPGAALVGYLKQMLPKKPVAELYIALGHHKHGKTELYRDLLRHLRRSSERFDLAPGTPGMVMVVFVMPGYDIVFKVIRDHFPPIKPVTPESVRNNYRLVFRHDRAGRLVEAQEFEHLEFDRARFTPRLLEEFERDATREVQVTPDRVIVQHSYIERRVTPLDVWIARSDEETARAAIDDFGRAVKDLAANNIFPGELLPKNFGLTRHARVVCYDYDELGLLTDFYFRELPQARDDTDDLSDEAWFGVGPRDVFPVELARFLTLPPELRSVLDERHGDLYALDFWRGVQARVREGEIIDIYPYPDARRLRPASA